MRLLFLNYEYPPLGGGAGNATFYILREYSKMPDVTVDLVTASPDGKFHLDKMGENVFIHKIPVGKKTGNLHFQSEKDLLFYLWRAYFYAGRLAKKNSYDLSHSFFSVPCGFISWRFKSKFKIPYIISLRGADVPGYAERFYRIYKLLKPLIKIIWKGSAAVISNSEGLRELALKTNPHQKIDVIYNGIDTDEFKPDVSQKDDAKFVITPGASRITARKGLSYLVEAVAQLSKKYPNLILEIVGDGNEKQNLIALAAKLGIGEKVHFAGVVSHQETVMYYQKSDVFVLPSLNEGMSNAMLEALACGLPVLATETGGSKELIREGENGFFIKMKDSADIAEKIERLIVNPELKEKMSQTSRSVALTMNWREVAEKYQGEYTAITKKIGQEQPVQKITQSIKKNLKLAVKLAVMTGFIAWLVQKIEWPIVLGYLKQMDIWWMLAFMAIYVFGLSISVYKWKLLADFKNLHMNYWQLFKIYLTGAFINNFLPSIIGGDTYRSYKLGQSGREQYLKATSTVLVDRICGFLGVMVLILFFSLFNLEAVLNNPVLIVANVVVLLSFGFEFFLLILRMLPIWNFVKKVLPRKITELIQEILSYRGKGILLRAVFWGVIFNFVGIGLASWMIFQDLHIPIDFSQFMIAISIVSIVSSVPVSIGNIGIKEWAYITFFGIFGVNGEAAISIAIFGRFLQMIVNFFAIPFYLEGKKEAPDERRLD